MTDFGRTAADLIKAVGLYELGGYDGCPCTSFEVRDVAVNVGCRKSSGMEMIDREFFGIGVRVTSNHFDASNAVLEEVAREVCGQLAEQGYDIMIRYCTYEQDAKNKCVYCGGDRGDPRAYLCANCLVRDGAFVGKVADDYAYSFTFVEAP